MPDNTRNVIRPHIIIDDLEHYRNELRRLTGASKILLDLEETE